VIPKLKPWLDGAEGVDLWIGPVAPVSHWPQHLPAPMRCGHCHLGLGRLAAPAHERDGERRGQYLGAVCPKCRDEADDTKRAVLAAFDKMTRH